MSSGILLQINISRTKGKPLHSVEYAWARANLGIEGDRYFEQAGTFSAKAGKSRDISLIEIESLEALERDYGLILSAAESRRNLLTQNVPLNHFVNKIFSIGDIIMKGIELCQPCAYLERLTQKPVKAPLAHRAGLRAQILRDGCLRVGDVIAAYNTAYL